VPRYDLIVGEPWDFSGPDGENRVELAYLGRVEGSSEKNWDSEYLLFQVLHPFEFSGNSVQQIVAAPRYVGDSLSKIRVFGGIVAVARVIDSTGLQARNKFGPSEVEYIIIGKLKRRWLK
jgi:hypothetical protein